MSLTSLLDAFIYSPDSLNNVADLDIKHRAIVAQDLLLKIPSAVP